MKTVLKTFFVFLISIQIHSQERLISGVVTDESGLPLPGVNVLVKGTSKGVQTDFDGLYRINVKDSDVLVFSFIGYITTEKKVEKHIEISVSLEIEKASLDEIVIVGYSTKRESKSLSYTVSSLKTESVSRALSGKVAGLEITDSKSKTAYDSISEPQSGQLTAGEINDLEKWSDWLCALKSREPKNIQNNWGFYLQNKIEVYVLNNDGNPVNNVKVTLFNDFNEQIMTAKTDVSGKVVLFKDLNKLYKNKYFVVQVINGNNVLGKKITDNHKNVNFLIDSENVSNDIDVMFTVDATGSMSDEINYLKSEIKNIISRLDSKIDKKRVALTFYRDSGDEYLVRDFDFDEDIESVRHNLSKQSANGGGDYEEAVEQALKISLEKAWNENAKSRLMFLLLDAPPHLTQENVSLIKNQIKKAQEKGIKIIPIVASGADKNVEFLMRFFSLSTNGTYVFLTDDSGIGNPHIKPTTPEYKVEKLNDLIVRLIKKYSGIIG